MIKFSVPVILASGSPRRMEILSTMGIPFTVCVSDADEHCDLGPEAAVGILSLRKAEAVAREHQNAIIIAADTLVACDGAMGKPHSEKEAESMLRRLSDRWHDVYTGVAVKHTGKDKTIQQTVHTRVHFVHLSDEDISSYIATGEPMDKAGAYAIQGMGGMFIDEIDGSYSNVIGLPMAQLYAMLKEMERA